jgi:hypothetical protein
MIPIKINKMAENAPIQNAVFAKPPARPSSRASPPPAVFLPIFTRKLTQSADSLNSGRISPPLEETA